jgi:4,5:9,10-diseco-3-hydroxy-5,9,17-trioxoandrosta-1(10),2-diene-4-oate hydrolase
VTAALVGRSVEVGDGRSVYYHEAGEGLPVVLVHGSGPGASGLSNFRQNVPTLVAGGYRVLVPDTLGFGGSSKPDDVDYTLEFMVAGLRGFLDALGLERVALIGNSLGGAMCIQVALDQPERVSRLVLMAPGGLEPRERYFEMRGIRTMLKVFFDPNGITAEGMRKVFSLQLFDTSGLQDRVVEERLAVAQTQPKRVFETMRVPDLSPRLCELSCPILALWGMNDHFCPPSGAMRIAEQCKRARVVLLTECGHWVMVEHAALFDRLCLDFLAES